MFQDIDKLFEMNSKYREIKDHLHSSKKDYWELSGAKYSFHHIVGVSEPIQKLKSLAAKVAKSNSAVLLSGQSGTGKELFAHAIHRESYRRFGPFITVNCAAVPEALFESELFGYKEGSFTGAKRTGKKGKFSLANKGTIFFDEISEMPLTQQVKLLRVLQEKEIEPVGGGMPESVDVRVIAATNQDLSQLVKENKFRQDLYYRLNVILLPIPPLKERKADIPPLMSELLQQLQLETGISTDGIEPEAEQLLINYDWPGNIRELRNVLERALHWKEGSRIRKADLPEDVVFGSLRRAVPSVGEPPQRDSSLAEKLERFEEQLIRNALQQEHGDKQAAARKLGISKSSFYKKLEKYAGRK